jgi:hypothetical protein
VVPSSFYWYDGSSLSGNIYAQEELPHNFIRYREAYTYANVNFIKSEFVFTYSVNSNIRIELMYNWFLSGEQL